MNLHAALEYLKYRWLAKGLHDIHSPFVYAFAERVLQNKDHEITDTRNEFSGLTPRYVTLLNKIIVYFNLRKIIYVTKEDDKQISFDALVLNPQQVKDWNDLAEQYFSVCENDCVVIVMNIHQTVRHTTSWNDICAHEKVRMSIDLYGVGLLFFRSEFKQRQHFVLRYPAG